MHDVLTLLGIYWPLLLGNVMEWYEFGIYGFLEAEMQANFFQGSAMATWLGFAVSFAARPLGGLLLGIIGDKCGRRASMNISIWGMLLGTVGQGLLPRKCTAGVVLLVALRLLQGLCTGGEIGAITTYIVEVSPRRSMGRCVALISLTVNLGFLFAPAVVFLVSSIIGDKRMLDWGWRIPFLFALVPGGIAGYFRRRVPESNDFIADRREQIAALPAKAHSFHDVEDQTTDAQDTQVAEAVRPKKACCRLKVVRNHGYALLLGIGGVATNAVVCYAGLFWTNSYLVSRGCNANQVMLMGLGARSLQLAMTPMVGYMTDCFGIGTVMVGSSVLVAFLGMPIFAFLSLYPTSLHVSLLCFGLGFAVTGAASGVALYAFVPELFPTEQRNRGVGISFNIGVSLFGGLAPVLAEASLKVSPLGPGFLLSGGGVLGAITMALGFWLQRRGVLQLAHVRPDPYFKICAWKPKVKSDSSSPQEASVANKNDLEVESAKTVEESVDVSKGVL